jgi:uncharacterized protein YndB with AHSA1/START domain
MTKDYPPIELSHDFTVPSENVYNAWTNPEIMKQWMFKGEANDIIQVINNVEHNGAYSLIKKGDDGGWLEHYGTYHEIVKPNLLSFSLEAPERFEGVSNIIICITPTDDGSHMHLLQTGGDPAFFVDTWKKMFERLEKVLMVV